MLDGCHGAKTDHSPLPVSANRSPAARLTDQSERSTGASCRHLSHWPGLTPETATRKLFVTFNPSMRHPRWPIRGGCRVPFGQSEAWMRPMSLLVRGRKRSVSFSSIRSLAVASFTPATHHPGCREPITHILTSNTSSIRWGREGGFTMRLCLSRNKSLEVHGVLECKLAVMIISTS